MYGMRTEYVVIITARISIRHARAGRHFAQIMGVPFCFLIHSMITRVFMVPDRWLIIWTKSGAMS